MNLQEYLNNAVKVDRMKRFGQSSQLCLGELILKLKSMPPDSDVILDFDNTIPYTIDSWRGSYDEIAICYTHVGDSYAPKPWVAQQFCRILIDAIGNTFTGYKGGTYIMDKTTPVWVANYGESGNRGVSGVRLEDNKVIIETDEYEF